MNYERIFVGLLIYTWIVFLVGWLLRLTYNTVMPEIFPGLVEMGYLAEEISIFTGMLCVNLLLSIQMASAMYIKIHTKSTNNIN